MLNLRVLVAEDQEAFLKAAAEFDAEGLDQEFAIEYNLAKDFKHYVQLLADWSQGKNLPSNFVASTFLVAVVENKIVGRVSIRHELNDYLYKIGGHIGYAVIPSERRKGYATEILKQALRQAQKLNLQKVLITTDLDNTASKKVILKNNGLQEELIQSDTDSNKLRFWVTL